MINCVMKLPNTRIMYTGTIAPSPHLRILPNEIVLSPNTWLTFLPRIIEANENTSPPIMRKMILLRMVSEIVVSIFSMGGASIGFIEFW